IEVIHFKVKPEREVEFSQSMTKVHGAIQKTAWPVNYMWYERQNGGDGPEWVLVLPHANYADMAGPEMSFPAMLEKGLGADEAKAMLGSMNAPLYGTTTELMTYRADLSYVPEAAPAK